MGDPSPHVGVEDIERCTEDGEVDPAGHLRQLVDGSGCRRHLRARPVFEEVSSRPVRGAGDSVRLLAPALAWVLSRPSDVGGRALEVGERAFLRGVARRTWRFFETFVGPEDNYLPVDNYQEFQGRGAAHRTSPTNMGLSLTASLAAYDFGYLSACGVLERTSRTFGSLDKLQRYRGHFFNWYDTQTLAPLQPAYVSTVDSGNLAGHLLTLAAGLEEIPEHPIFRRETFQGLRDTLKWIEEVAPAESRVTVVTARLLEELGTGPTTPSGIRRIWRRP